MTISPLPSTIRGGWGPAQVASQPLGGRIIQPACRPYKASRLPKTKGSTQGHHMAVIGEGLRFYFFVRVILEFSIVFAEGWGGVRCVFGGQSDRYNTLYKRGAMGLEGDIEGLWKCLSRW